MNFLDPRLPDRFWSKVQPEPNSGCWLWTGRINDSGYGRMHAYGDREVRVHRIALGAFLGRPLTDEECACHRCDTRLCVNPAHLFAGSRADNIHDMVAKGRGNTSVAVAQATANRRARTECKHGHALVEPNLRVYIDRGRPVRECRACKTISNRKRTARSSDSDRMEPRR